MATGSWGVVTRVLLAVVRRCAAVQVTACPHVAGSDTRRARQHSARTRERDRAEGEGEGESGQSLMTTDLMILSAKVCFFLSQMGQK